MVESGVAGRHFDNIRMLENLRKNKPIVWLSFWNPRNCRATSRIFGIPNTSTIIDQRNFSAVGQFSDLSIYVNSLTAQCVRDLIWTERPQDPQ